MFPEDVEREIFGRLGTEAKRMATPRLKPAAVAQSELVTIRDTVRAIWCQNVPQRSILLKLQVALNGTVRHGEAEPIVVRIPSLAPLSLPRTCGFGGC